MEILGKRVYLVLPEIKESNFSISPELKEELLKKEMQKLDKLKVYDIGLEVKSVKKGDTVQIDPIGIQRARRLIIDEKQIISVVEDEIMHIW